MCANLSLQGKDNAEAGTWWGMRTLCLNTGIDQACTESICIKQAEGKGRRPSRLTMLRQEMSEVAAVTDKEQEQAASHLGIWEVRRDHFFHGLLEKWHCYTHEVISNAYGKSLVWTELCSRNGLELSFLCHRKDIASAWKYKNILHSKRDRGGGFLWWVLFAVCGGIYCCLFRTEPVGIHFLCTCLLGLRKFLSSLVLISTNVLTTAIL